MISLSALLTTVLYLIIAGLICWLIWWLIGYCNVPEPFNKVARVLVAVVAVLICIAVLLSLATGQPVFKP